MASPVKDKQVVLDGHDERQRRPVEPGALWVGSSGASLVLDVDPVKGEVMMLASDGRRTKGGTVWFWDNPIGGWRAL